MKLYKSLTLMALFSILAASGIALMLKAAVGVGAFDAATQSFSLFSGIKIGTIAMMLNLSFVAGQWLILKRDFGFTHMLQIPLSILLGTMVNFFYYDFFGTLAIESYILSLLMYIVALVLVSFSTAIVMAIDLVTFPIESLCMSLAEILPLKFGTLRQLFDVLSVVTSVVLTLIYGLTPSIREGTVIGMLIFGPLMGVFINKAQPILKKSGIVKEVSV